MEPAAENPRNLEFEVRESVHRAFSRLPFGLGVALDAIVTWVSGCPYREQKPLLTLHPALKTVLPFLTFFAAMCAGHLLLERGWWVLLPLAWLVAVGAMWSMFLLFHHVTHNTFFSPALGEVVGRLVPLLIFTSSLARYRREHIKSHHTPQFCTERDEEGVYLMMGFVPGRPKEFYWRRLWLSIFTPGSYLMYLRYRLWVWQMEEPAGYRWLTWAWAAALVAGAYYFALTSSLILVYAVPVFILFNVAGILGTFTEHHWGCLPDERSPRARMLALSQGRFLLDEAPRSAGGWVRWWARFFFYHLPVRVAVLPAESQVHDFHHRHPSFGQFGDPRFERLQDALREGPGAKYTHAWSLGEALDRVFTRMSLSRP